MDKIREAIPSVAEKTPNERYEMAECPAYNSTAFQGRVAAPYEEVALTNEVKKSEPPKQSERYDVLDNSWRPAKNMESNYANVPRAKLT